MIKLTRITKEALELKFNPAGSLSNASFEGQNVTSEIRYLEKRDCVDCLEVFGFRTIWPLNLAERFQSLNEKLGKYNLSLFNIELMQKRRYGVYLCDLKDESFIHKTTRAVLLYNIDESFFTQVVRLFELNNTVCRKLLKEDWS